MEGKPLPVALKVVSHDDGAMYAAHQKIYPREVNGRFQRLRKAAVFWLLGMYYLFPWINWDDRQIVLFDLPARKFYIFGLVFWPQDFFYLSALLIVAALSLFFFTALAGRLWCGFACPQTVWTEVFLWMERWVEGDRNAQMRLDKGPWNARKLRLKATKQFLWITFALWTGFTFVGFFTPIRELGHSLISWQLGGWELFWFLFYSLATYGNAGLLREQVCKYMCPYARFQSAMIDKDTLVITYDDVRGEPRGARKRSVKSVAERRTAEEPGLGTRDSIRSRVRGRAARRWLWLSLSSRRRIWVAVPSPESRVPSPGRRPSPPPPPSVTASTARPACWSARPASISVMACSMSASAVRPALMPVMK